jgi:hypothetical protein
MLAVPEPGRQIMRPPSRSTPVASDDHGGRLKGIQTIRYPLVQMGCNHRKGVNAISVLGYELTPVARHAGSNMHALQLQLVKQRVYAVNR